MAGRILSGSASDGFIAYFARVGEIGVESSSRCRSSSDRDLSLPITSGGRGCLGGGFTSKADFAAGGPGFVNACEDSGSRS